MQAGTHPIPPHADRLHVSRAHFKTHAVDPVLSPMDTSHRPSVLHYGGAWILPARATLVQAAEHGTGPATVPAVSAGASWLSSRHTLGSPHASC